MELYGITFEYYFVPFCPFKRYFWNIHDGESRTNEVHDIMPVECNTRETQRDFDETCWNEWRAPKFKTIARFCYFTQLKRKGVKQNDHGGQSITSLKSSWNEFLVQCYRWLGTSIHLVSSSHTLFLLKSPSLHLQPNHNPLKSSPNPLPPVKPTAFTLTNVPLCTIQKETPQHLKFLLKFFWRHPTHIFTQNHFPTQTHKYNSK